jgi:hypothetical protein
MSYRIYVNNHQLFGNNDCPNKWIEFIKSQGIEVSEDGMYKGEIKDFMECLNTVEDIVFDMNKKIQNYNESLNDDCKNILERQELFDLSNLINDESSLLFSLQNLVSNGYLFLPYQLYEICKDKIEVKYKMDEEQDKVKRIYTIKEGEHIYTSAY